MKRSIYITLLVLIVFPQFCVGQNDGGVYPSSIDKLERISVVDIIGDWYSTDSTNTKITFKNVNDAFVEIEGIRHGVGNYSFWIEKGSITVRGSAPNWPPYDCTLKLINAQYLEIEFYQFHSAGTTKASFIRKQK
jgi:hypothetical protein